MNEAAALVRASHEAYVRKDRQALEALMDGDFHFSSLLDNRIDRASYFARCWPNSEGIGGFQFIHLMQQDHMVFVTWRARAKGGGRFRNTEVATTRDGRIVEVEVYFGWSIPHPAPACGSRASEPAQRAQASSVRCTCCMKASMVEPTQAGAGRPC